MRVVIGGSPGWTDERAVAGVFAWIECERASVGVRDVVLVYGADGGACELVAAAATARGWEVEPWPSDPAHGKSASMIRNQRMLEAGRPDLVVVLTSDLSRDRSIFDLVARARARRLNAYVVGALDSYSAQAAS